MVTVTYVVANTESYMCSIRKARATWTYIATTETAGLSLNVFLKLGRQSEAGWVLVRVKTKVAAFVSSAKMIVFGNTTAILPEILVQFQVIILKPNFKNTGTVEDYG